MLLSKGYYKYTPKGGMCAGCKNKHADCSGLPFSTYRVIEIDDRLEQKIVKCKKFEATK